MRRYTGIAILILALSLVIAGCTSGGPQANPVKNATPSPASVPEITPPAPAAVPPTAPPTPVPTSAPIPDLRTKGSVDKTYYYVVRGNPGFIPLNVYTGVNDYIASLGDIYSGDDYARIIDNPVQREYTKPLVTRIRDAAVEPDDEARIAINLVQHIKYDANTINEVQLNATRTGQGYIGRYPYTILYQNWGGICGEKSFLLVHILKELGYGTALFEFEDIHHMAVGIRAPEKYAYRNTGYALVESTAPEIPTSDEYALGNTLIPMSSVSPSRVIKTSDGRSFDTIDREYADAQVERSIYLEVRSVNSAAAKVRAARAYLDGLETLARYWKTRVDNDLASRDMSTYQNDLSSYNSAVATYNNFITEYNRLYAEFSTLYQEYQQEFLPKQRALDEKYGLLSGMNVGL